MVRLEQLQWRRPDTATSTYTDLAFGHPFNNTPPDTLDPGATVAMTFTLQLDVGPLHEDTFDVDAVLSVDDVAFTALLTTRELSFMPNADCDG